MKLTILKLYGSSILVLGINFLIQVFLARVLSVGEYGLVIKSMAAVAVTQQLILLGLPYYMVSVANREDSLPAPASEINSLLAVNAIIGMLVGIGYLYMSNNGWITTSMLILLSAPFVAFQEVLVTKAQIERKFTRLAALNLSLPVMRLVSLLIMVHIYTKIITVSSAIILSAILTYCIMCKVLENGGSGLGKIGDMRFANFSHLKSYKKILLILWPFGFDYVAYMVYYQMPILCLGWVSPEIVSNFSVAFSFIGLSYIFPVVLFQKIAPPYLSEWLNGQMPTSLKPAKLYIVLCLIILAGTVLTMYYGSSYFIARFFGEKYLESAEILEVMLLALLPRYASTALGALYISRADVKVRNRIFIKLTIVSAILFPVLINVNSLFGAAYAYVIVEVIWAALYFFNVNKTDIFKKYKGGACTI